MTSVNCDISTPPRTDFIVSIINYADDYLIIEGELSSDIYDTAQLLCSFGNDTKVVDTIDGSWYKIKVPVSKNITLSLSIQDNHRNTKQIPVKLRYKQTSRLSGVYGYSYRLYRDLIIISDENTLKMKKYNILDLVRYESAFFLHNILKDRQIINILKMLIIEPLRIFALARSMKSKRLSVWLFTDRAISGGDNSEILFRHVSDLCPENIKPYFAVDRRTKTYKELKESGYRVISFRSLRHLYLAIVADVLLPSHLDAKYMFPWAAVWYKYAGLMQYKIAHTQHGIVINDMSQYIGRRKKNADIFLSVCEWEKKVLLSPDFDYQDSQVHVTGAPRYDNLVLKKSPSGVIAIHPTWRSWLALNHGDDGQAVTDFKQSRYFKFYQSFLNDDRLIRALNNSKYSLRFYLHPNHREQVGDFTTTSSRINIMKFPYDYNDMINNSDALITDYSNISFDFAYTRKPIVYTQFDAAEFFQNQESIKNQIFDYKSEGFGPVCMDYEETIGEVVSLIKKGCNMSDPYLDRANRFFTFSDNSNCERAFKAIKSSV